MSTNNINMWLEDTEFIKGLGFKDLYYLESLCHKISSFLKNVPIKNYHNSEDFFVENFSIGNITGIAILGVLAVVVFLFLKIIEFILIINAAVKSSNGEKYKYPMSFPFFK